MKYMKLFAVMLVAALMVVAGCEKKAGTDATGAPADVDGEPATTDEMQDESGVSDEQPEDVEGDGDGDAEGDGDGEG